MLIEKIEATWLAAFQKTFALCQLQAGDTACVLSESQSRRVNVDLAMLALQAMQIKAFELCLPSRSLDSPLAAPVPVRSTGASDAIAQHPAVIAALQNVTLIVDCTVEGLLHAPELPAILKGNGSSVPRHLMISNEHPEILERTVPDPALEPCVRAAMKLLRTSHGMHVTSAAGTNLRVKLKDAVIGGGWGYSQKPGMVSHWPGGLALGFPAKGAVNGQLVLAAGDVNLSFKTYLRDAIELTIINDYITQIDGTGLDVETFREHLASWEQHEGTRDTYAVSPVGFGLNPKARWDAMNFYDKRDFNGTELRAFAGNFLYSIGANEVAGRHTQGHFDLPMRGCTIDLHGMEGVTRVIEEGRIVLESLKPQVMA
jgi:2,5-dihydroxypyridine 5,6-dioxygenase